MKNSSLLLVFVALLQCLSCKTESKNTTIDDAQKDNQELTKTNALNDTLIFSEPDENIKEEENTEENVSYEREPNDEEIRIFGIIKHIEDGPYPMFVITVEFPEHQREESFNLNIEALPIMHEDIYNTIGNYATLYYEVNEDNFFMDLRVDNKSIYGENDAEIDTDSKHITGILTGAEYESGDLPSTIYITDDSGVTVAFKEFVTSDIVAQNNTKVTGYYYSRYNHDITYFKASEN